jgi:hypothetical protein
MNIIANNPITTKDINIAEQIFRINIASLKGKITRKKPKQVNNDYINIPIKLTMKQQNITV